MAPSGPQCDLERLSRGAFGGDSPALLGHGLSQRSLWTCDMSAMKENAPDSMEPACMLCRRAEADPNICGRKLKRKGICAHEFCVFFANELFQKCIEDSGFMGFVPEDIRCTIEWAEEKDCFVCGESGATITCQETGCKRTFHLPCAMEGGCITQYFGLYRSFCWEHRPEQAVEAAPEEDTVCLICLDPVEDKKSYSTMVCPTCKHAWFHRGCIQGQAVNSGIYCFQCPLCRNRGAFLSEMLTMGIRIPLSLPSWEENMANTAANGRHRRCDARECLYPGGREQAEEEGPWQLLLCSSCAAEGTHRRCSSVSSSRASWECDGCAGLGTASSASSQTAGPSTASQAGAGPSRGSPTPGTSSPSTASQAGAGPSRGSPTPGNSSPSTGSQAASRPSHGSLAFESGSCSSTPGPDHIRNRSRLQRRSQIPYSRPRRRPESSREQASRSQTSTPSLAGLGPSSSSLALETTSPSTASQLPSVSSSGSPGVESDSCSSPSGPMRVRDRSCVQHRAQNPCSRPRRRCESSQAPTPSAESSTPSRVVLGPSRGSPTPGTSSPSTDSQLPSGSSCRSPEIEGRGRSGPPGPVRVRELSRVQRQAQNPYSRPRRRRARSRAPGSAEESGTPGQVVLGRSHRSPVPRTNSPSTTRLLPSGSSPGSPAHESGSRSTPPGPVRMRESSRVERRAQNPYSRPGRRHRSSRARSPSAGPDPPPPAQ